MRNVLLILFFVLLFFSAAGAHAVRYECEKSGDKVTCTDSKTKKSTVWVVDSSGDVKRGALKDCPPLPVTVLKLSGCIMCPIYKAVFDVANELIEKSFNTLAAPLQNIMSIIFAIVIALKTLEQISSLSSVSTSSYLNDILKQGFKFVIAFLFLSFYEEVYYWIINPILIAGIEMGAGFLDNADMLGAITPEIENASGKFISGDVYNKIDAFSQAIHQELSFMLAVGASLVCISFNSASLVENFIPDISVLISGLAMFFIGFTTILAIGFYLIDGLIQLCFVGILTPFSIASFPFGFSQKWMLTTWKIFLDTVFKFIFMGLLINMAIKVLSFAVSGGVGDIDYIVKAMNANNANEIESFFNVTSTAFITFCICGIFAKKLAGKISGIASSFSGGSIVNAGGDVGGLIFDFATKPVKWAGEMTMKIKSNSGIFSRRRIKKDRDSSMSENEIKATTSHKAGPTPSGNRPLNKNTGGGSRWQNVKSRFSRKG